MKYERIPSLQDLLAECFDAVHYCPRNEDTREDHIYFVRNFLSKVEIENDVRAIFEKILNNFSIRKGVMFSDEEREENENLAKQIDEIMIDLKLERYVYHGTIFGRLKDIQQKGLLPGANPVWKEHLVSRQHCDSAVFFSRTWRGASQWAEAAHDYSRGPREGKFRRPVVLRIPMTGLNLEHDSLSAPPDSCMVRAAVQLYNPYVIIGRQGGIPTWCALEEVTSKQR